IAIPHDGATVYGRESRLPLCQWPALLDEIMAPDSALTCTPDGGAHGSCTYDGVRPLHDQYSIVPSDPTSPAWFDIDFDSGADLYVATRFRCERRPGLSDLVREANVRGHLADPLERCTTVSPAVRDTVLAEVAGGVIEHLRPGLVRGTTVI